MALLDVWRIPRDEHGGPHAVIVLGDVRAGHEAVVVIDDVSAGPAVGGVRMAPDVTVEEVARLARAMTLKNAAAGLPHGGAKAGILADPHQPAADKERVMRWFATAIRDLRDYIPGPDVGTDEICMAWVHEEIGRCVGLPKVLGGIPLDEIGATAYGLTVCAEAVASLGWLELKDARIAIQGFGAVGKHAARFLAARGARIVAVSDSAGAVEHLDGLDAERLAAWKDGGHPVKTFPDGAAFARDDIVAADCDVLIPAARPDFIHAGNVDQVRARVILSGANIPVTADAERVLFERGVLVVPDFIANAGGVICAVVEYRGGSQAQSFTEIEERIRENTIEVLETAAAEKTEPRIAAERMAWARVERARQLHRSF